MGTYTCGARDVVIRSTVLVQRAVDIAGQGSQLTETGGLGRVAAVIVAVTL